MREETKKSSTRLDTTLCLLTIIAAVGLVACAAFAPMFSSLSA